MSGLAIVMEYVTSTWCLIFRFSDAGPYHGPICSLTNPDPTATIAALCDGQQSCTVRADNTFMGGDPCQGTVKHADISYSCGRYCMGVPIQMHVLNWSHWWIRNPCGLQQLLWSGSQVKFYLPWDKRLFSLVKHLHSGGTLDIDCRIVSGHADQCHFEEMPNPSSTGASTNMLKATAGLVMSLGTNVRYSLSWSLRHMNIIIESVSCKKACYLFGMVVQ